MTTENRRRQLVAQCLETARVEVCRRLAAQSLPTSVRVQLLVIIDEDDRSGGWRSAWEEVSRSSLRSTEVMLAVRDESLPLRLVGLRDQLTPLAAHLDETTSLGEPPGVGYLPSTGGVEGVLGRVASPLAHRYLLGLDDLAIPDPELVERLTRELNDFVDRVEIADVSEVVLSGVTLPSQLTSYRDVRLRLLTPAERGAIYQHREPFVGEDLTTDLDFIVPRTITFFDPVVLLSATTSRAQGVPADQSQLAARVVLALTLHGYELGSPGVMARFGQPRWALVGATGQPFPVQEKAIPTPRPISQNQFEAAVDLAFKMPDFGAEERSRSEIVLYRVLRGTGLQYGGFLDFAIALEAALLGGAKTELAYRFALYGALFLAEERDPDTTFKQLKRIYRVRRILYTAPQSNHRIGKPRRRRRPILQRLWRGDR